MTRIQLSATVTILATILATAACSGDKEAKGEGSLGSMDGELKEERLENGLIRRPADPDADGVIDVVKYLEEVPDPDDPATTIRRLRKMELDVNGDGTIDVVRTYGPAGKLAKEEIDNDLNGKIDATSYYDRGALAKKEIFNDAGTEVEYTRYYAQDNLLRIERDTNNDGLIDYWEYYEEGVLDRIGRDFNADGRADSWQKR